jgi:hypothetical protein
MFRLIMISRVNSSLENQDCRIVINVHFTYNIDSMDQIEDVTKYNSIDFECSEDGKLTLRIMLLKLSLGKEDNLYSCNKR